MIKKKYLLTFSKCAYICLLELNYLSTAHFFTGSRVLEPATQRYCTSLIFNKKVFELSKHHLSARRPSCDQQVTKSHYFLSNFLT